MTDLSEIYGTFGGEGGIQIGTPNQPGTVLGGEPAHEAAGIIQEAGAAIGGEIGYLQNWAIAFLFFVAAAYLAPNIGEGIGHARGRRR